MLRWQNLKCVVVLACGLLLTSGGSAAEDAVESLDATALRSFLEQHCTQCHDSATKEGGLDLTALPLALEDAAIFSRWVKVHDRVREGEMPPEGQARPPEANLDQAMSELAAQLTATERTSQQRDGRSRLRRLNRVEFENTLRDLLSLPGLKVKETLPEDGKSQGFDRLGAALDISFVHVESYLAAVDKALNAALCPLPEMPPVFKYRYKTWDRPRYGKPGCEGWVHQAVGPREAIGLIGLLRDETFKPVFTTDFGIQDDEPKATAIAMFRHEDADFRSSLTTIHAVLPGIHRLRVSGYSIAWDGKQVVPTERHGALSWGIHSTGEHFGTVDLPPKQAAEREISAWLERGGGMTHGTDDNLRIVSASCQNVRDYAHGANKDVLGPLYPVPGVAIEWVEIEGPIHEQWPPASHQALFGDLPVKLWTAETGVPKPVQQVWSVGTHGAEPQDIYGHKEEHRPAVYFDSKEPAKDIDRLLRAFLPRAFRRPVTDEEVADYALRAQRRLDSGVPFQDAMLAAYRAALTSPDFLLLREPAGELDNHALAARLSYFLWSSLPDSQLFELADQGRLREPHILREQTERLLNDPKAARFTENFLGQWLALREINATQPDKKLYPEFMPWLQEAMLLEDRAYFNELLQKDLGVTHLVQSDFAFLNEPLAEHYGIEGVRGWDIRRVALPAGSPRGGFLTMGSVLKTTAAGTTTSPVKRGAFVMEKLMGVVPVPPPPDVGAIEPDVRGATTIREQLDMHRHHASCAGCHKKMDGYGFALESFDVTGEWRSQYRAIGPDYKEPKFVHGRAIEYRFGPSVDCAGVMPDGRPFKDVNELRALLAADPDRLAYAFTSQLLTYATGAGVSFADRETVEAVVDRAQPSFGLRSLLHEIVQSEAFRSR